MADINATGFDEVLKTLDTLASNASDMAIMAVDAAVPLVESTFKSNIQKAANRKDKKGRPYSTGALARSVVSQKAKVNKYGAYSVVKVTGIAKSGSTREEQLRYLEFGTKKQEPHPARAPTIAQVNSQVQDIMQKKLEQEIDRIWEG